MTRLREVAMRIREVHERIQRFEEIELGRVREEMHDAERVLMEMRQKKYVSEFPGGSLTGGDIQQWSRYLAWVDGSVETSQRRVYQAEREVDEQTSTVTSAYRDARKWRDLEAELHRVEQGERQRREQQEADDDAVRRRKMGDLPW